MDQAIKFCYYVPSKCPHKIVVAAISHITLSRSIIFVYFHSYQGRFTYDGSCSCKPTSYNRLSQMQMQKGRVRKRWLTFYVSAIQKTQMLSPCQFFLIRLSQVRITLVLIRQRKALTFGSSYKQYMLSCFIVDLILQVFNPWI